MRFLLIIFSLCLFAKDSSIQSDVSSQRIGEVQFRSWIKDQKIYVEIKYQKDMPSLLHRPWILKNEQFIVGKQLEDSIEFSFSSDMKNWDLWKWGANRSKWGKADDWRVEASKRFPDQGLGPWKLNLEPWKISQDSSRYLEQKTSGSRADVAVTAKYESAHWRVLFSRKLNTDKADDVVIEGLKKYSAKIKIGNKEKSFMWSPSK